MSKISIYNTLFVFAGARREDSQFFCKGVSESGYKLVAPYKGEGLLLRILREICFRLPFTIFHRIWYNKEACERRYEYILIKDPLITKEFLFWLATKNPTAQLNFCYDNLVGWARHIYPKDIPDGYRVWTYDAGDSEKYGIRLCHTSYYFPSYIKPLKRPKYDVLFVGRDKGRAGFLLNLKKKLNEVGLIANFIIVKNDKISKAKSFYQKQISYNELTDLITESRSILNISLPGQKGITVRDMESLYFGIKLITTNEHIKEADFYDSNNIFILNENNVCEIKSFLEKAYRPISRDLLKKNTFEAYLHEITQ